MGSESSSGQMAQAMKATTRKAESMVKESSSGLITLGLKVSSWIIIYTDTELTPGLMAESIQESGLTTKWKELENSDGQTADATKAST